MEKPIRGSAQIPDHVMVSINGDAETQMAVTWRTSTDIENGFVLYRTENGELMRCDATKELFVSDIDESNIFSALLTELNPDTKYYYTCGDASYRSDEYSFRTAPKNLTKFKFICVSDQQQGQPFDCPDYSYFQNFVKKILKENPDVRFILTGGDNTDCGQHEDDLAHGVLIPLLRFCKISLKSFLFQCNHLVNFYYLDLLYLLRLVNQANIHFHNIPLMLFVICLRNLLCFEHNLLRGCLRLC